ncbi:MAG: ABC transporter permease subunit [Enterobacteriaceae bacterium]
MRGVLRSFWVSLWFMALTFPIVVIKVSTLDGSVSWRWGNALLIGVAIFFLSFIWRALLVQRGALTVQQADLHWLFHWLAQAHNKGRAKAIVTLLLGSVPLVLVLYGNGMAGWFTELQKLSFSAWLTLLLSAVSLMAAIGFWRDRPTHYVRRISRNFGRSPRQHLIALVLAVVLLLSLPGMMDMYQVNVLTSAFIWVMLGLGLNIVVGQAGLLVLGYAAFYAVCAYLYAAGNQLFGNDVIGFWIFLPLGGLFAMLAGVLLCLPVLRLRGDYLAIVTLGFGEIVRVTLEGGSLSLLPLLELLPEGWFNALPQVMKSSVDLGGPAGIANIPYPGFFGVTLSMDNSIRFVYYIALFMMFITIISVSRLRDSRVGRSWMALREDEIACEAMGINKITAKLSAFVLGACWAGFGGVLFAAKTTFINPTSFTFMESVLILSVVVLGGLDSIKGVILGACVLVLLPEDLRFLDEYRMLIFGASMVLMMVFRPQGLIPVKEKLRWPQQRMPAVSSDSGGAR